MDESDGRSTCRTIFAVVSIVLLASALNVQVAPLGQDGRSIGASGDGETAVEQQDVEECRLWAITGDPVPGEVIMNHLLNDVNCLKNLSYLNPDGWGIGYNSPAGSSTVLRGEEPAYQDLGFDWAVGNTINASPDVAVGHVRKSTNVVEIANPHPFERYRMGRWWLFGHNGAVNKQKLRELITESAAQADWITYFRNHPEDIPYCYCQIGKCQGSPSCICPSYPLNQNRCLYNPAGICGTVDSELYFVYILKCIEEDQNADWGHRIWNGTKKAVTELEGFNSGLNFFLTDGDTLWAFRCGNILQTLHYYDSSPNYCAAASTPPDSSDWTPMDNWQMVILRKGSSPIIGDIRYALPPSIPEPPEQPAWPEYTGYVSMTAPVLADFDPYYPGRKISGTDQWTDRSKEVISAIGGGHEVFVWHEDGTSMNNWSPKKLEEIINPGSPPAVGDLDKDGLLDLVIAAGQKTYAFNASGEVLPNSIWPQSVGGNVTSAPVLADLDKNGYLEVLISSKDGNLYIWNHDGTIFDPNGQNPWPKQTNEILYWSPAVGNLDQDAELEIVVGGGGPLQQAPFHTFVWNIDGSSLNPNWPKVIPDNYRAFTPSLANINPAGNLEIVMGVGYDTDHGRVYVWDSAGNTLVGWPNNVSGYPSWCSISDIDPVTTQPEIVTSVRYDNRIYAWRHDGVLVSRSWPCTLGGEGGHSPAIGYVDGDGDLEVVAASYDGHVYVINSRGPIEWEWTTRGPIQSCSSTAIGDIDYDRNTEVVQPSMDGCVHIWEVDSPGAISIGITCWPMLQHDERHTGRYRFFADIHEDLKVDIKDIAIAAKAFGSIPGYPGWNAAADVNNDLKVDIKDLALIAKEFGWVG